MGLNPAFDDSGQGEWSGGIGGHGRRDLRCLLIEGAHAIVRSKTPLGRWAMKLFRRKSQLNLVVAAVARKLTVAVWYLMMGRWTPLEEVQPRLQIKIGKIISQVGPERLKASGKPRNLWREEALEKLKTGKLYVLDPDKKFESPAPIPAS